MVCRHVRNLLDHYRDGQLTEARRGKCEAHLKSCPDCRGVFAGLESAYSALRGWEEAQASEELTARVIAAWRANWPRCRHAASRRRLAGRLAAAAGAAAVVSAMGLAAVHIPALLPRAPAPPAVAHGSEAWLEQLFPELALANPQPEAPPLTQEETRREFRGSAVARPVTRC